MYIQQWWVLPRNIRQGLVRKCRMGRWRVTMASLGRLRMSVGPLSHLLPPCILAGDAYDLWLEGKGSAVQGVHLCYPWHWSLLALSPQLCFTKSPSSQSTKSPSQPFLKPEPLGSHLISLLFQIVQSNHLDSFLLPPFLSDSFYFSKITLCSFISSCPWMVWGREKVPTTHTLLPSRK